MTDNIVEVINNTYTVSVETNLEDNNHLTIELIEPNTIDVINNTTVLVGDLPEGYPISWTSGNLPVSRVSGLIGTSGILYDNGIISISGIPYALIPVHDIVGGSGLSVINNSGIFTIAVTGQFGLTGEQVDDRVSNLLVAGNYINLNYNDSGDSLTLSVSGLQPSGNYSVVGHNHTISEVSGLQNELDNKQPSGIYASGVHYHSSNDITDFNVSVSGLLPVKNISSGSGIGVSSISGDFTVSVTGTFGLTGEQVDDRVSQLLVAGDYINLNYDDNLNSLTISSTGLQPSGNYSVVGHTHTSNQITDFNSAVSGLIPPSNFTSLTGLSGVTVTNSGTNYFVTLTDSSIQLADITDLSSDARTFLLTPSSSNLSALISDETGSGSLVFNNSPALSGTPTVPTAPSGTNNTQIANTSFVRTEISNLVNSAPSTLDTLNELATALGNDPNFATTVTNNLANKANLSGAIFTGSVTIPSGTGNFNSLTVNNTGVSLVGHTHTASNITDFNSSVSGIINNSISTSLVAGTGVSLEYFSGNNTLVISTSGVSFVGHQHTSSEITDFNDTAKLIKLNEFTVPNSSLDVNSQRIINVATAVSGTDAINKNYVDTLLATTTTKGIASFSSNDFSVSSGVVIIKASGIDNNQLVNSNIVLGTSTLSLGSSYASISGLIIDGGSP